jgi:hypothetical protein
MKSIKVVATRKYQPQNWKAKVQTII